MKKLPGLLIHTALISLIVVGGWWQVAAAMNIAVFGVWVLITIALLAMCALPGEVFSKNDNRKSIVLRALFFVEIGCLIAYGWLFTAAAYLGSWVLIQARRELGKQTTKSVDEVHAGR